MLGVDIYHTCECLASMADQEDAVGAICDHFRLAAHDGRSVWVLGNGGSSANAQHLVLHLRDIGIKAHDLMDLLPHLTAQTNDFGYVNGVVQHLLKMSSGRDTLVVLSGSGNSENVVSVLASGRSSGLYTIALLGFDGGKCRNMADVEIIAGSDDYGIIEDCHGFLVHHIHRRLK